MKKFSDLLEKDLHIVEKRKIIFAIPIAIIVIAAVLMIIFNFTLGSPLNLGTDFTGGYSIDIKLGNKLTDKNYETYCDHIEDVMSTVTTEEGKEYSVRVDGMQRQGADDSASIHVKYFAVKGASESEMIEQVNPALKKKLENEILMIIPEVTVDGNTITATYGEIVTQYYQSVRDGFNAFIPTLNSDYSAGIAYTDSEDNFKINPDNSKQIVITCDAITSSEAVIDALINGLKIDDIYSGSVTQGDLVGATVSTELLFNAILAVALALVFMLCYIGLRFQLSSGLACIIALFHDVLIMFAFMAICHIEINSTFIAALITILGYSINNSIIVFDRVRENMHSLFCANMTPEQIANKSIRETLLRSINTTITTLIMIVMVAIIGVSDIRIFAFPIIIGLLAGTFSSICIAPSFWALFQRVGKKGGKKNFGAKSEVNEPKKEIKSEVQA